MVETIAYISLAFALFTLSLFMLSLTAIAVFYIKDELSKENAAPVLEHRDGKAEQNDTRSASIVHEN